MNEISFGNANPGPQVGVNYGEINISPNQQVYLQERIDDGVLRSLAFPQMLDRRDNIEPCHTNTCQWILELETYQSWRNKSRGLLWIKGKPGAGKSTLMVFLHDRLKILQDDSQSIQLNFFFTARGTEMQRTPLGMLRSLLNQLFTYDVTIRPQVREIYEQRCKQFGYGGSNKWEWPRVVLEELLAGVILASASRQHITVFVDALDEAGAESAQQLAAYFHRIMDRAEKKNVAVRICISCRYYPIMESARAMEIHVEEHNDKDIATYIKDILADTEVKDIPNEATRQILVGQLIQQANGVFQWARLVMPLVQRKIFEGESLDEVRCWLREVPAGLEDVYMYTLNNVIEARNRVQSFLLFQWVCLAERPLTVTEMRYALAAKDAHIKPSLGTWENIHGFVESNERMKRRIKTLSGGLAEVVSSGDDDETVQVIHQSVNDFLRTKGLGLLSYYIDSSTLPADGEKILFQCQATLYRTCLVYLATVHMPQEILDDLQVTPKDIARDRPLITYSTENLLIHAEKAAASREYVIQNEQHILQQVISRWVQLYQILYPLNKARPPKDTTMLHMAAAANLVDIIESVVFNGMDVMRKDGDGNTAFHLAARHGHITAGKVLRGKGADKEAKGNDGITPLIEAASRGHVRYVEWLVHEGVKLEGTEGGSESALQAASLGGYQSVIDILLGAGADVNTQGGRYGNALQAAAYSGHTEIVQMLLDSGADVNAQGGIYGNALQAAGAAYRGRTEIVQMLLDAGADVNAQGGIYGNALQAAGALYRGRTEIVQMLLDAGADINTQGGRYGNALQAAAFGRHSEIVQILLDSGADVNAQGGVCGNALQAAAYSGHTEIVQMLLDSGANVNAKGGQYGNALQAAAAAYSGNTAIVQMLLDADADVNAQGGRYGSPLLAAVHLRRADRVQMLLHAGADALLADELDQTPLHIAASEDLVDLLNRFPLLGSAMNNRDKLLQTPLHLAICLGHIDFAIKLLHLGANPSLLDGYGKNVLDWVVGNESLMYLIQSHCPPIVVTPLETQKLNVRQSILQISHTVLHSKLNSPWPLSQQLGRYLLFLDEVDNAHSIFQLSLSQGTFTSNDIYETTCTLCKVAIIGSYFVCRICAHVDLCVSCERKHPYHSRLHPNQEHETFQVLKMPDNDSRLTSPASEQLNYLLSNLVHGLSVPNTHGNDVKPSDDSVSCSATEKTALYSWTFLSPTIISFTLLFGLLAVLLTYWYF